MQWASAHATMLSAIVGLIVVVPVAAATLTHPVVTWIDGRVDVKIGPLQLAFDGTSSAVRDLQIEQAEGKLSAVKNDQVKWELELKRTQNAASRGLIQKQMLDLELTRGRLEQQLKTLNEIRSRR